jgi:hypothetical protein
MNAGERGTQVSRPGYRSSMRSPTEVRANCGPTVGRETAATGGSRWTMTVKRRCPGLPQLRRQRRHDPQRPTPQAPQRFRADAATTRPEPDPPTKPGVALADLRRVPASRRRHLNLGPSPGLSGSSRPMRTDAAVSVWRTGAPRRAWSSAMCPVADLRRVPASSLPRGRMCACAPSGTRTPNPLIKSQHVRYPVRPAQCRMGL